MTTVIGSTQELGLKPDRAGKVRDVFDLGNRRRRDRSLLRRRFEIAPDNAAHGAPHFCFARHRPAVL